MNDIDLSAFVHDTDEGSVTPPDPDISLSIRFPLVLESTHRQRDGLVILAWAAETGEALFCRKLKMGEDDTPDPMRLVVQKLPPSTARIVVALYDGDDGRLLRVETITPPTDDIEDSPLAGIPLLLARALDEAGADPDESCAWCDDSVPEGKPLDPADMHRECLLANIIGPLGHHLDHAFWCENLSDPHCGRGARQAALDLYALVERHGMAAIVAGDFPKDGPIGSEGTDG